MRRAFTLLELVIVLAAIGILAAVAIPRAARFLDGIVVRGAAGEVSMACTLARHLAIQRSARASVGFDSAAATVAVHVGPDTVRVLDLGRVHGVELRATRAAIAYGPTGLGYGASTATVIVARGSAADTIYVSRLGRVRR
jgi:prepilin-type N-terminal cleavage/methylation domain-containing protein